MKIFGKVPSAERQREFAKLSNYQNGQFQNLVPTSNGPIREIIRDYFQRPAGIFPSQEIPAIKTDLKSINVDKPTLTWFGHSSYIIQSQGLNVLVDPVFCGYSSPFPFYARAFKGTDLYKAGDMPLIDVLIITHDHYDHLDYETMVKLKDKVKHVVVPLGVGDHLQYWGWDVARITELNWGVRFVTEGINITATPAIHISGRGLGIKQTLWASYVLYLHGFNIFIGGDSGYGSHFKQIGEEYGPFDIAVLENGQYNKNWHDIHLFPEETLTATRELRAEVLFPVHWGKFCLGFHPWNEPAKRIWAAAD